MSARTTYGYWNTDKPKEDGYTQELISSDAKNILDRCTVDTLDALPFEGIDTLYKGFKRNVERIPNNEFLGGRTGDKFEFWTFRETADLAENLSHGMMAFGMCPEIEAEDTVWKFVGLQAKNRKEWYLTYIGAMYQRITTVGLYDTLGPDATRYIIDQTQMATMFMSKEYIRKLIQLKLDEEDDSRMMSSLCHIVSFDNEFTEEEKELAEKAGITLYTFEQVIFKGREAKKAGTATINEPTPEDCVTFSYTSGTTGNPKGVKLTHKMLVSTSYGANTRLGAGTEPLSEKDTYISYLPSAHSFEQCIFGIAVLYGTRTGCFGGNVLKLTEDMQILKPTFMPSVPRLLNRIYGKIKDSMDQATGLKGWLVKKGVESKMANVLETGVKSHAIYDTLIFKKTKAILGGNVRLIVTGSAPISGSVLDFLKIAFCCHVMEGYGLTETTGGAFIVYSGDKETGIVGGPCQSFKIKLKDIPEMNYLSTDNPPRGEICFWGPGVMDGYFKNPEKTAEAFDGEWFRSGDVGVIQDNFSVKIIDRAKNIFKLSQGEYIAPEKLENVYVKSPYVLQSWMYGDSLRDYIIGFIIVDPEAAEKYCKQKGIALTDQLYEDNEFKQAVLDDLVKLANENKFNSLEKPKQLMLIKDPWTVESDILTPTLKLKRNIAKQRYVEEIKQLYEMPPLVTKK